jgi:hypothetical protein
MTITNSTVEDLMYGYEPDEDLDPDDDIGVVEALVLAECNDIDHQVAVAEAFAGFGRIPGQLPLDAHDLAGITLVFGDLSACD